MFDALAKNTLVPLLLRCALAVIFIYHGLSSVSQENQWGAAWMKGEGADPAPIQLLVAWGELIGGIAMALGFLTRLAAIGLVIIMAGAVYKVHWPHGFDMRQHGYEYNFAIIMICLALILVGGGNLAVDRIFRLKRKTPGK